jgi:hypothetical protein
VANFTGAQDLKKFKELMVTIDRIDSGGKAFKNGALRQEARRARGHFQSRNRAAGELYRHGFPDFIKPTGLLSVEGLRRMRRAQDGASVFGEKTQ